MACVQRALRPQKKEEAIKIYIFFVFHVRNVLTQYLDLTTHYVVKSKIILSSHMKKKNKSSFERLRFAK